MEDTKSLIEKYKRELMELGKSAPKPAPEPKKPQVIGYVSEESGEFPAVFDRIIAEAVANSDRRDSAEGYPDIDSPEDDIAFSEGRDSRDTSPDASTNAMENAPNNMNGAENNGARPEDDMNQGTGETISNFPVSTYST